MRLNYEAITGNSPFISAILTLVQQLAASSKIMYYYDLMFASQRNQMTSNLYMQTFDASSPVKCGCDTERENSWRDQLFLLKDKKLCDKSLRGCVDSQLHGQYGSSTGRHWAGGFIYLHTKSPQHL